MTLSQLIRFVCEHSRSGYSFGTVQDFKADLAQEIEDLQADRQRFDGNLPHIATAKRICLKNKVHLREDGTCFRKLSRILWDILDESCHWALCCVEEGKCTPFYPKALKQLESGISSFPKEIITAKSQTRTVTISQLFDRFREFKKAEGDGTITEKSLADLDIPKRIMIEFLGDVEIHTLSYDDFQLMKSKIGRLPPRKDKKYFGKSFGECIKKVGPSMRTGNSIIFYKKFNLRACFGPPFRPNLLIVFPSCCCFLWVVVVTGFDAVMV